MRFQSLPTQVANYLRSEIANGRWINALPGERNLAATLRVSRRTVAGALVQLQRAGVVRAEPGRGHRIISRPRPRHSPRARQVGLLAPAVLDAMRPNAILWVHDLQSLLAETGFRLNLFYGAQYFSGKPGRALAKLVAANPQAAWILSSSTQQTQQWFAHENLPTLVSGTSHDSLNLPDVDLDYHALGRHVAGRIVAHRHRKAALFLTRAPRPFTSELQTERGFREVLHHAECEVMTVYHERTRDSLLRALRRLFSKPGWPTALVLINSFDYLTTTSFLSLQGLRVPWDVSVISRNDDVFMNALLPEPTRYHASPHVQARKLYKLLMQVIAGEAPLRSRIRIMPEFIAGETLAPPARPASD